jgi:LPS-assembly lipoprotein
MSWSRGGRLGRGLVAALLLATAGCGFHPLYGTTTSSSGGVPVNVQQQLESIRIVPSANRIGQQLYNSLRDKINPRGEPSDPRYVLTVTLRQSDQELLLEQQDSAATRTDVTIFADYHMRVAKSQTEVLSGTVRTRTGYNLLSNEYASRVALQDALGRSAEDLADEIRQRLALYLAQAPATPPAAKKP